MKIETWKITRVKPYPNNPRRNDQAVDAVADSLRQFGWRQPIVVDKAGVIIAGHTRYKAAQKLGMTEVPVHVATELTPQQVKAYRLADNRSAEFAEWDADLLKIELGDIPDIDLSAFDFGALLDGEPAAGSVPPENKAIDEDAMKDTKNECPKCGFKW